MKLSPVSGRNKNLTDSDLQKGSHMLPKDLYIHLSMNDLFRPLRGLLIFLTGYPGRCPGLKSYAPMGLETLKYLCGTQTRKSIFEYQDVTENFRMFAER